MGKSAYTQCGQAAGVGIPVGCVRISSGSTALLHLRSTAFRKCEEYIFI